MDPLDDLLQVLARRGPSSGPELCREAQVSQATLSRLLATAGERVWRTGRARATRYTATRAVAGLDARIPVFRVSPAGQVISAGALVPLAGGDHGVEPDGEIFGGLPPFALQMAPQGFLARHARSHLAGLDLPGRVADWTDDHHLLALARRGEDAPGDVVLGTESVDRLLAWRPEEALPRDYPALVQSTLRGGARPALGGDHPKITAFSAGRHVLVKFAAGEGAAARRDADLLACEALALAQIASSGRQTPRARWFDASGHRFLEVERFDRAGERGRRGVLSLSVIPEAAGLAWTPAASRLHELGMLSADGARHVRWLDTFGQLIANEDRHAGNLSFLAAPDARALELAPAYDMRPTLLAAAGSLVVRRAFEPAPPTAATLDVWRDAASHAVRFWSVVAFDAGLDGEVRAFARDAGARVEELLLRFG